MNKNEGRILARVQGKRRERYTVKTYPAVRKNICWKEEKHTVGKDKVLALRHRQDGKVFSYTSLDRQVVLAQLTIVTKELQITDKGYELGYKIEDGVLKER